MTKLDMMSGGFKCAFHDGQCQHRGIVPAFHSGNITGGTFVYYCPHHAKGVKNLDSVSFEHINEHEKSINRWTVTATTRHINELDFRGLQRDGWQVARNGYHGAIGAYCQALNSVSKWIHYHEQMFDIVTIVHHATGMIFQMPASRIHEMKRIRDRLNHKCFKACENDEFFVGFDK